MSFGWGVGDIMAISKLAIRVYSAYKDAPNDYKNIAEEVNSLQIMINKAAQHFKSTTLTDNDRKEGQEVLKGCQSVLEDLSSLIEEYSGLASSSNGGQIFKKVKLGTEDIATLRARLTSNATLLGSFIRRFVVQCSYCYNLYIMLIYFLLDLSCEHLETQAQLARLNAVLSLHRTNTRVSIDSIPGSINTKRAYKKFIKSLHQIGVTADMIKIGRAHV